MSEVFGPKTWEDYKRDQAFEDRPESGRSLEEQLFIARLMKKAAEGFSVNKADKILKEYDQDRLNRFQKMSALDYLAEGTAKGVAALRQSAGGILQFLNANGGAKIAEEARQVQQFLDQGYDVADPKDLPYEHPSWWGKALKTVATGATAGAPLMAAGSFALPAAGAVAAATAAPAAAGTAGAYGATALLGSLQTLGSTYDSWMAQTGSEDIATEKALQAAVASGAINAAGGVVMARLLGNDGFKRLIGGVASDQVLRESLKTLGKGAAAQGAVGLVDNTTQNVINELPAGTGALEAVLLSMVLDPSNAMLAGRLGSEYIQGRVAKQSAETFIPTIDNRLTKAIANIEPVSAMNADPHSTKDITEKMMDSFFRAERQKDQEVFQNMPEDPEVQSERQFTEALDADAEQLFANTAERQYPGHEPRTMPAPPDPETPMVSIRDLQKKFTDALGVDVFTTIPDRGRALGYLNTVDAGVRIRRGSLDTLAHEIGHRLDFEYNLNDLQTGRFDNELLDMSVYGSRSDPRMDPEVALAYTRGEGAAEAIRAYIINPAEAREKAPNFIKAMEAALPPEKLKAMQEYGAGVRRFYGSTAQERIGSQQVSARPPKQNWARRILDFANQDKRQLSWDQKLLTNWVDRIEPFTSTLEIAKQRSGKNFESMPSKDPVRALNRLLALPKTNAPDVIENGYRNTLGDVITEDFATIFQDIDKARFDDDLRDAFSFMIAKTTKERLQREFDQRIKTSKDPKAAEKFIAELERRPLTGSGSDYFSDYADVLEVLETVKPSDADRYTQTMDKIGDFYRALTGELNAAGIIKGQPDLDSYVPLRRILETEPGEVDFLQALTGDLRIPSGTLRRTGRPGFLKSWKGSTAPIRNIAEQMLEDADRVKRLVEQKRVVDAIEELYPKDIGVRGTEDFAEGAMAQFFIKLSDTDEVPKGAESRVWNLGKDRKYLLTKDFADSLGVLDDSGISSPFINLWTSTARMLRDMVVYMPNFAVRNVIKDFGSRMISSDIASFSDYSPKQIAENWQESVARLRNAGVNAAGLYKTDPATYGAYVEALAKDMQARGDVVVPLSEKLGTKLRSMKEFYTRGVENTEMLSRVAEYQAAKKDFKERFPDASREDIEIYATDRALELMNFTRAGRMVITLNKMLPFTNAAIQSLRRTIKTGKANPKGVLLKATMGVGAMKALAYGAAMAGGYLEEYQDLPWYQRDMGFSFKLGPRKWLWIPGPFEYAVLGSGLERSWDYAMGNEKAFEGLEKSAAASLIPLDESALVGPQRALVEVLANYDFFRKRSIIPSYEKPLDVDARVGTENASAIGKFFQKILGVDPRFVDHLATGLGGNLGLFVKSASDAAFGDDIRQARALRNAFGTLTGMGFETPIYSSPDVQWLFENAARLGVAGRKDFKRFTGLLRAASHAETEEDFTRLNRAAQEMAEGMRRQLEPNEKALKQKQVRRAEEKRG